MEFSNRPYFSKAYDPDVTKEFVFSKLPEAPVFEPTYEEFKNPIEYICKIREVAEKAGICKIKPPPDWQPPFAVDVDNFKFVPRVQRINELEAKTRVKLNFLDQIAKYWTLQGIPLKIPVVEKKTLDLYALYDFVQKYGGMEKLDKTRSWHKVCISMGFDTNKSLPQVLRTHYMKILHPYYVFCKTKLQKKEEKPNPVADDDDLEVVEVIPKKRLVEVIDLSDDDGEVAKKLKTDKDQPEIQVEMVGNDYKPHRIEDRQAVKPPKGKYTRRTPNCFIKTEFKDETKHEDSLLEIFPNNKELARLAFFGAGPKLPGYDPVHRTCETKTRGRKVDYNFDPLEKYTCKTCSKGDKEESILLCDGCDDSYHTHCLVPPLLQIPEGDWRCPQCVALEVGKPVEAFGFEQAQQEYTLQQFGEMADTFKKNYFRMEVYSVPHSLVEKEFWRVVSCIDEDVTVQYGADLHTMDHGSGFPTTVEDDEMMKMEVEYLKSPWNLNNLPVCEGSVLQFIDSDISGMKVPWMYVGMCFATFCWHNEDHWNYSINYLHWGEPKTWYGVPGSQAMLLEETMRSVAPELFLNQPDLLQQLVTIMNPHLLVANNVSVVRTDQKAGEFVVTFPRAYHAGFNQGYNFAEAVNFAPANWIRIGRECVEHYSTLRRFCVFSHDELIIRMAEQPERLTKEVAFATHEDLAVMAKSENLYRKKLKEWGLTQVQNYNFEVLADDERVCEVCKTTCFISGVTCECMKGAAKHTCLKHFSQLCACPPQKHILSQRYTLKQLCLLIKKLQTRCPSVVSK